MLEVSAQESVSYTHLFAKTEAAGEAERGKEADEADWEGGYSAGGIPGSAARGRRPAEVGRRKDLPDTLVTSCS